MGCCGRRERGGWGSSRVGVGKKVTSCKNGVDVLEPIYERGTGRKEEGGRLKRRWGRLLLKKRGGNVGGMTPGARTS